MYSTFVIKDNRIYSLDFENVNIKIIPFALESIFYASLCGGKTVTNYKQAHIDVCLHLECVCVLSTFFILHFEFLILFIIAWKLMNVILVCGRLQILILKSPMVVIPLGTAFHTL